MNIFGEGLPLEILNQVKHRQKVYGSGYNDTLRTPEEILYLNSKTSWCKLVSGVDIGNSQEINNPFIKSLPFNGNEFAKKYILFNGTTDESNNFRFGVNNANDLGDNYAYGVASTEFGLRPMMGIKNASIRHENRGSLRRAEVKIKAFNKYQFDIIDTLYLRLGFSVLLEWGHSIIINNEGIINTNPIGLSLANEFLEGNKTYSEFLDLIYNQRLSSVGNYDAMMAKVANFSWSLLPDGSYDITVYLSSIGDIIESIKINTLTDSPGVNNTDSINNQTNTPDPNNSYDAIIDPSAFSHTIGNFLFMLKTVLNKTKSSNTDFHRLVLNSENEDYYNIVKTEIEDNPNIIKFNLNDFEKGFDDAISINFVNLGATKDGDIDNRRYYVRLGTFLNFLQSYIAPYYFNTNNNIDVSIKFDFDVNTNLMNVYSIQTSVDPRICFVNRVINIPPIDGATFEYLYGFSDSRNPFINSTVTQAIGKEGATYGNIMNIYLDCSFILSIIDMLKDDKGNLSLIDFLQGIMRGINEGLGGINDFDVFLDDTNNTIRIIDKNPLNNVEQVITFLNGNYPDNIKKYNNNRLLNEVGGYLTDNSFIFQLFGYKPDRIEGETPLAGFIKEFSLKTEISSDFANMITVGAAAQGTVVGENNTALSKLNKGFIDRFKKTVVNNIKHEQEDSNEVTEFTNRVEELKRMYKDYLAFLQKLSNGTTSPPPRKIYVTDTDINTFKSNFSSLVQKAIEVGKFREILANSGGLPPSSTGSPSPSNNELTPTPLPQPPPVSNSVPAYEKEPDEYQGTGFLPFNLSLTLDGLSGVKINQQFFMDTSYMPSNYPETLTFIIRNLVHEISDNRWITRIETYSIPKAVKLITKEVLTSELSNNSTPTTTTQQNNNISRDRSRCAIKEIPPSRNINPLSIVPILRSNGFSNAAIAGILGNLEAESGFDLNAFNPEGGGCGAYGLAQWRGDRQTKLYNYARSINRPVDSLDAQVRFLIKEVSEDPNLRGIKTLTLPDEAAFLFASKYERFSGSDNRRNPSNLRRKEAANRFFSQIEASGSRRPVLN